MTVFVDTSALYALMDRDDRNHPAARDTWRDLLKGEVSLLTTSYVVVEITALVQHRLGIDAVRTLLDDIIGVIEIHFVVADLHRASVASLLTARQRGLSLVDCVSFQTMRDHNIGAAFTFDRHFQRHGFRLAGSHSASDRET